MGVEEKTNEILDRVIYMGVDAIGDIELKFLNSLGKENQDTLYNKLMESEIVLDDGSDLFKFRYLDRRKIDDGYDYYGYLYAPKIRNKNGEYIGKFIFNKDRNDIEPYFIHIKTNRNVNILDLYSDYEYELDNFIDLLFIYFKNNIYT
jgi:hypothetical protein